ncbi:hypothetical protein EVAR_64914_1 [Eumeta japonica]|uniref:Uncharacterized protein n=1 Tax=Eumeta variegata TaxID=151549 RepID=A0A4C1ZI15_EUMVA|nr:hypothetical protein EVAR_64914_1 [Eumeta japonica]
MDTQRIECPTGLYRCLRVPEPKGANMSVARQELTSPPTPFLLTTRKDDRERDHLVRPQRYFHSVLRTRTDGRNPCSLNERHQKSLAIGAPAVGSFDGSCRPSKWTRVDAQSPTAKAAVDEK